MKTNILPTALLLLTTAVFSATPGDAQDVAAADRTFYVDSVAGDDSNSGLTQATAWQSLARIERANFLPGDSIRFKRGSQFMGTLRFSSSGTRAKPIVLGGYGSEQAPAARFTNATFEPTSAEFGNCIRLQGSFVHIEDLHFHHTVAELSGRIGFTTMWELGAVYIEKQARHCLVRNNEFFDCGVAIKSYGEHAQIRGNYIHDCNRVLKEWNWGPIGIWLGADRQEVSHNRIINYSVVHPRINWGPNGYGRGADGSAIEIDDARIPKSNIAIHHNYTRGNQGFLEVTWADVARNPPYRGFHIHHNISDDYQQFIALWRGEKCIIENNTIVRRRVNANEWGVFNITQHDSANIIRNNIVVTENDVVIFNVGKDGNAKPDSLIANNLFFAASGKLRIGLEGPGEKAIYGDPRFIEYSNAKSVKDFAVRRNSPAIDQDAVTIGAIDSQ